MNLSNSQRDVKQIYNSLNESGIDVLLKLAIAEFIRAKHGLRILREILTTVKIIVLHIFYSDSH